MKIVSQIVLIGLLIFGNRLSADSQTVKPLSFHTIVDKSGVIAHGVVKRVESGTDPKTGLICTWTTLDVVEGLKGIEGKESVTFKQYGGVDKKQGVSEITDLAILRPGEEVLICLYPTSTLGLTSPVGVTQGIFSVRRNSIQNEACLDNGMPIPVLFPDEGDSPSASSKTKAARKSNAFKSRLKPCKSMQLNDVKKAISDYLSEPNSGFQPQTLQREKIERMKMRVKKSTIR